MHSFSRLVVPFSLILGATSPLAAQSGQYTVPGTLGVRPVDGRAAMRSAIDAAPWRLGPIRLDPWVGVRDAAWVKKPGEKGDLTVAFGAGLRAYLPVGSRLVFTAHALPEYVWWRERDDGRFGGRAGLGAFLALNRFVVEVKASSSDLDGYVTPEVQRRTEIDSRALDVRIDVPIGHRLDLFVRGARSEIDVTEDDPELAGLENLDRVSDSIEGGVRYRIGPALTVGVGGGTSDMKFEDGSLDRSNDGSFVLGELDWSRNKTGVHLSARKQRLAGKDGSEFGSYDGTTWSSRLFWAPHSRWSISIFGQSELIYSINAGEAYFLDERLGLRLTVPAGSRFTLGGFYETGENRYPGVRSDDVSSWGGSLSLPVVRRFRLAIDARTTRVDGESGRREIREVGARLSLGTDRLSWF